MVVRSCRGLVPAGRVKVASTIWFVLGPSKWSELPVIVTVYLPADLTNGPRGVSRNSATPSHLPWRGCSSAAMGWLVLQPASRPRRKHGRSRKSAGKPGAPLRFIFIFGFGGRQLKDARRKRLTTQAQR